MIVALVVLALLLVAGQVERVLSARDRADEQAAWGRERARLLNAVIAETPGQYAVLERQTDLAPREKDEDAVNDDVSLIGVSG